MGDPVAAGSDVSEGTYQCTNCGYELEVGSTKNLPPCPSSQNGQSKTVTGGDRGIPAPVPQAGRSPHSGCSRQTVHPTRSPPRTRRAGDCSKPRVGICLLVRAPQRLREGEQFSEFAAGQRGITSPDGWSSPPHSRASR